MVIKTNQNCVCGTQYFFFIYQRHASKCKIMNLRHDRITGLCQAIRVAPDDQHTHTYTPPLSLYHLPPTYLPTYLYYDVLNPQLIKKSNFYFTPTWLRRFLHSDDWIWAFFCQISFFVNLSDFSESPFVSVHSALSLSFGTFHLLALSRWISFKLWAHNVVCACECTGTELAFEAVSPRQSHPLGNTVLVSNNNTERNLPQPTEISSRESKNKTIIIEPTGPSLEKQQQQHQTIVTDTKQQRKTEPNQTNNQNNKTIKTTIKSYEDGLCARKLRIAIRRCHRRPSPDRTLLPPLPHELTLSPKSQSQSTKPSTKKFFHQKKSSCRLSNTSNTSSPPPRWRYWALQCHESLHSQFSDPSHHHHKI